MFFKKIVKSQPAFSILLLIILNISCSAYLYAQNTVSGSMDKLNAYTPANPSETFVLTGYHTPGDGGEGTFTWLPNLKKQADGATVIKPTGNSSGAWLRVSQSNFISVKWFGAYGDGKHDDTQAIQDAINNANGDEVYIPAGTYRITKSLRYITTGYAAGIKLSGSGEKTVLDYHFANSTPFLLIDGASAKPYQFQRGGYIKDLKITSVTVFGPKSQGDVINLTGWWLGEIKNVIITRCFGNGIVSPLRLDIDANPDAYSSSSLNIEATEVSFIDGVGIWQAAGIGCPLWHIQRDRIGLCKGGGVIIGGNSTRVQNNAIFSNGNEPNNPHPGLAILRIQTNSMGTVIEENEFDSNVQCHILLGGAQNVIIQQNRFNSWQTAFNEGRLDPPVHIKFDNSIARSQNINVLIRYNYHRSQNTKTGAKSDMPLTLYDLNKNGNNSNIEIMDPVIPTTDNTTNMSTIKNISGASKLKTDIVQPTQPKQ
jgi:hypothetical protein